MLWLLFQKMTLELDGQQSNISM